MPNPCGVTSQRIICSCHSSKLMKRLQRTRDGCDRQRYVDGLFLLNMYFMGELSNRFHMRLLIFFPPMWDSLILFSYKCFKKVLKIKQRLVNASEPTGCFSNSVKPSRVRILNIVSLPPELQYSLVPVNQENDFAAKSEKLFFRIFACQHQK